jgi:Fe(3+) dicitrate transport protein
VSRIQFPLDAFTIVNESHSQQGVPPEKAITTVTLRNSLAFILIAAALPTLAAPDARAEDDVPDAEDLYDPGVESDDPYEVPEVTFRISPGDLVYLGAPAFILDERTLELLELDSPDALFRRATGVYVRSEDGFGLRPNIGLRGASSDRSKKVALTEDGILFGPAPYSAPAAYYFPLMTRMRGIEVFKGPAAVQFGPNTIGGAINVLTRNIPSDGSEGGVDLAYGRFNYLKGHLHAGAGGRYGGMLAEVVHLSSTGFKTLDGARDTADGLAGDTGFSKQEVMLKGRVNTDPDEERYHQVDIKLGFSKELSNETYLGLTDADFGSDANRRYAASQLGEMTFARTQIELHYGFALGSDLTLGVTLYDHQMRRSWRKLNRFAGGPTLQAVLAEPTSGQRRVYYDLLRGEADTTTAAEALLVGTNQREFLSRGAQLDGRFTATTGEVEHDIKVGARLHYDSIERNHIEDSYDMMSGRLVRNGTARATTTANNGSTLAFAGFVQYGLSWKALTLTPGVRVEAIQSELENKLSGETVDHNDVVLLPGVGVYVQATPELGFLAGVHRGFSPVSPGQSDDVEAETSLNYEVGAHYEDGAAGIAGEVVGFYSDYSNLVGECAFSAGCSGDQLDRQFNAGEVTVLGLEVSGNAAFDLTETLTLPVRVAYTYTHGEFDTAFESDNPQYGTVEAGDALPYVPPHQFSADVGVAGPKWGLTLTGTYVDAMRERAGQGDAAPGEETDAAFYLDVNAQYRPSSWLTVYVRADNVLNDEAIVARRPFGARPGKPLLVLGGIKLSWADEAAP